MTTITMTGDQYEALRALALAKDPLTATPLCAAVDDSNQIQRYGLTVLWQDLGGTPPRAIEFGKPWPAQQQRRIEQRRAVSRDDVDDLLRSVAVNPAVVLVTLDPNGILGLTRLEDYEF